MNFISTGRGLVTVTTNAAMLSAGLSSSTMPPGYSLLRKSGKTVERAALLSSVTPSTSRA